MATIVGLKASNGNFVCAEGGGGGAVAANRSALGTWEKFRLIDLGGGRCALQTLETPRYVCADNGGAAPLVANRVTQGGWETFERRELGTNQIALRACNGMFVCAQGGGGQALIANRDAIGPWETFETVVVDHQEAAPQPSEQHLSQDPMSNMGLDIGIDSMFRDEPGYRISWKVEACGTGDGMEVVLRSASNVTWWKSLSYFPQVQGGRGISSEIRIETKNDVHEAKQFLFAANLSAQGMLEFWKGGVFGFGAFAGTLPINSLANRGRRIIFTWLQD